MSWKAARTFVLAMVVVGIAPVSAVTRIDHEAQTTWREMTWEDFRGPIARGHQSAGIATTILAELKRTDLVQQDDGLWTARPLDVPVYAVMNKLVSGVMRGQKADSTLAHEQIHFDIAEIHARRLNAEVYAIEAVSDSRQNARIKLWRAIQKLHTEGMKLFNEMQASYDSETAHGTRKKSQKQWSEKVKDLLETEEPYPIIEVRAAGG